MGMMTLSATCDARGVALWLTSLFDTRMGQDRGVPKPSMATTRPASAPAGAQLIWA